MKNFVYIISFFIPGFGHLILKKYKMAIMGMILFALEFLSLKLILIPPLKLLVVPQEDGTYTIGESAWESGEVFWYNDSFVILIAAIFSIFIIIVFLGINYFFAREAKKEYIARKAGIKLETYSDRFKSVSAEVIPHAVTSPMYALMFIFLLIPALVSILIVFTNYATPILPPAYLIEW